MSYKFSEQDVDTVVRLLFENISDSFECMTNPPGGDWSGFSIFKKGKEWRWVSLKRVPGKAKRPDHVFQIIGRGTKADLLIAIESKDYFSRIAKDIGARMQLFLEELMSTPPLVIKDLKPEFDNR